MNDPSFTEPLLLPGESAVQRGQSDTPGVGELGKISVYRATGDVAVIVFFEPSPSAATDAARTLRDRDYDPYDPALAEGIHAYGSAVVYPDRSASDELVSGIEECLASGTGDSSERDSGERLDATTQPDVATPPPVPKISGTVTNTAGAPRAGIYVYACPIVRAVCGSAVTGKDGSYEVTVREGDYFVQFGLTSDGTKPAGYYSTSGFTPERNGATVLSVGRSGITGIDVQMPS